MQFRKKRKPTYFYVDLEVNRVCFSLRLTDITENGAKLRGAHEVVDGTNGQLTVRGHKLLGTLRWVNGDAVGFEFDDPLSPQLYALLAHEKKPPAKNRFAMG